LPGDTELRSRKKYGASESFGFTDIAASRLEAAVTAQTITGLLNRSSPRRNGHRLRSAATHRGAIAVCIGGAAR
jgi:hypothetical protein